MFELWFLGFISVIGYRAFNAGMNTKSLFYVTRQRYGEKSYTEFDFDLSFVYTGWTVAAALFWPVYCVFLLGKKFRKEA